MKFVTFEANRIANTRTKNGRYAHLVVMGFSQGGGAAHELVDDLNKDGVPVRLVITADPVHRGLATVFPFLHPLQNTANVYRWVNFFQKCDKKTFSGFAVKGHSVSGAENTQYDPSMFRPTAEFPNMSPDFAHFWMPWIVRSDVRDLLSNDQDLPLGRE